MRVVGLGISADVVIAGVLCFLGSGTGKTRQGIDHRNDNENEQLHPAGIFISRERQAANQLAELVGHQ
jgi:hypothetical protein